MHDWIQRLLDHVHRATEGAVDPVFLGPAAPADPSLAAATSVAVPDEVVAFLRTTGGQPESPPLRFPPGQLTFLSEAAAVAEWRALREAEADFDDEELSIEGDPEDHGRVRSVFYDRQRLPVATDLLGGQWLFVDLSPGPRGRAGQLVTNRNEIDFLVVATSLSHLLETYVRLLDGRQLAIRRVRSESGGDWRFVTPDGQLVSVPTFRALQDRLAR